MYLCYFTGSCWDLVFLLVAYNKYFITLWHVYLLVTIFLMVTHISILVVTSLPKNINLCLMLHSSQTKYSVVNHYSCA